MTADARFERDLTALLEDLYLGPTPAYSSEVIAAATQRRQRPTWRFAGRWLSMDDIAVRPIAAPRMPVQLVAVALILALLLVAALAIMGSRPRIPAPFGPARNGLITWALNGDIYVGDPAAGSSRRLVGTDDIDRSPVFSRDGATIAFLRQVGSQTGRFDLVVLPITDGAPMILTPLSIGVPEAIEWAPDGGSLLVTDRDAPMALTRYFVDGSPPVTLLTGVHVDPNAFRPPEGGEILYQRDDEPGVLYVMSVDGSNAHALLGPRARTCPGCEVAGPARWSPDGRAVAVPVSKDGRTARLAVINADGSGLRWMTDDPSVGYESDPAWSPDGTLIAFNRWTVDEAGSFTPERVGIVASVGGTVRPAPVAAYDGGLIEWSPDGLSILYLPPIVADAFSWGNQGNVGRPIFFDPVAGTSREVDWTIASSATWQRLAP